MKFYLILSNVAFYMLFILNASCFAKNQIQSRSARDASDEAKLDCRYEKSPWQECDITNGLQRRTLKLKTAKTTSSECQQEKFIERPCKKQCKYFKGTWSECVNGSKERIDKLKNEVSTAGCKPEKHITKQCKKQCTYEKSDWSPCENGVKQKVLTLIKNPSNSADCEPVKNIVKPCAKGVKGKRFRKKIRD